MRIKLWYSCLKKEQSLEESVNVCKRQRMPLGKGTPMKVGESIDG